MLLHYNIRSRLIYNTNVIVALKIKNATLKISAVVFHSVMYNLTYYRKLIKKEDVYYIQNINNELIQE